MVSFIFVLNATKVIGTMHSNIAWVNLNGYVRGDSPLPDINSVLDSFSQAIEVDVMNESAWFGLGMSYALQGNADNAYSNWSNPINDHVTLNEYGLSARHRGELDTALTLFRAAEAIDSSDSHESNYLAGTICQRSLAAQHMLSQLNRQYCTDYLADNENNLIVNGRFANGSVAGWTGEYYFLGASTARLAVEPQAASDDFAVRLSGADAGNHFGIFQRLTLSAGDRVRFSGRFRLAGNENLTARILFISWQSEDGTVQGNHGEQQKNVMEWTEFERTFTAPQHGQPTIDFYPVVFSGEGTVWFDDIRLELIHD